MPAYLSYEIKKEDGGLNVGQILRKKFDMSASVLKQLKQKVGIFLNDNPCRSIDKVKPGDVILADVSEDFCENKKIKPFDAPIDIVYEDDFILVANKPGGIETHPCNSNRESTLANAAMHYWLQKGECHNCHIVNRLDKNTSGICIIAKNPFAHSAIAGQAKNGELKKYYMAVIHGTPNAEKGEIDFPIGRSDQSIIKREVRSDGKSAKTVYEVVESNKNYSLVKILLKTGRTHQIRVHFSWLGHPLVGDWLYGNGDNEGHLIKRHALHAKSVEFIHPATKKKLVFDTEIPAEMRNLLNIN